MIRYSITNLNARLVNKSEAHEQLSKDYHLPDFDSKANTIEYLEKYIFADSQTPAIFMVYRNDFKLEYLPPLKKSVQVCKILELLENILGERNLPLTGLTFNTLPNIEYILRAIKFIDPDNEHEIFGERINLEQAITSNVNPLQIYF